MYCSTVNMHTVNSVRGIKFVKCLPYSVYVLVVRLKRVHVHIGE